MRKPRPSRSKYQPGRVIESADELFLRLAAGKSHYFGAFVRNAAWFVNQRVRTITIALSRRSIRVALPKEK